MQKPYGLMADIHLHNWKSFASVNPRTEVNTRLEIQLAEIKRCAFETVKAGGHLVRIAGDLFHVRGAIHPSVFNPTKDTLERVGQEYDVTFEILPGNHDMEKRESSRVGNAITSLAGPNVLIVNAAALRGSTVMVPWIESMESLKAALEKLAAVNHDRSELDLIIHAPVDGVITGLHGIDAGYLAALGFKRVFAGHYHQHKNFGNGVYSIGPLAPHTWSDVGIQSGFLIVHDDHVQRFASHAPDFVDVTPEMDEAEMALKADGNYVQVKTHSTKTSEINALREFFEKAGAKGIVIQHVKAATAERPAGERPSSITVGASLEASVADFVLNSGVFTEPEHAAKVNKAAQEILAEANAA